MYHMNDENFLGACLKQAGKKNEESFTEPVSGDILLDSPLWDQGQKESRSSFTSQICIWETVVVLIATFVEPFQTASSKVVVLCSPYWSHVQFWRPYWSHVPFAPVLFFYFKLTILK